MEFFHFGKNICFPDKITCPFEKKITEKISQGNAKKKS